MYKLMFAEYPDIVTVKDLQAMLGISRHAAYDLLVDDSYIRVSCGRDSADCAIIRGTFLGWAVQMQREQVRVEKPDEIYDYEKYKNPYWSRGETKIESNKNINFTL